MKKIVLTAALAVTFPTTALAQASGITDQPGNCAIYAEMLSKTVSADTRVTGTTETDAVETLDKFAAYLNGMVEASMADTYRQAAAYGMDKAAVDRQMEAGEQAIRAGFTGPTMEPNKVYTDHILTIVDCTEKSARRGELGAADVQKMNTRMNAVFMAIR